MLKFKILNLPKWQKWAKPSYMKISEYSPAPWISIVH